MLEVEQMLRQRNIKVTPQRLALVTELRDKGHLNIEELYNSLKKKFPSISLATIYKNLNAMIENCFVEEVKIPYAKSKYEIAKDLHSHVVCEECGKVCDIDIDLSSVLKCDTISNSGFEVQKSAFIVSGTCCDCQAKKHK
ncbi:MAG: Fur family transcriptional regulator [Arcobacteraceae bacterium]|jgi:Fur family peroxide stress response transcriptional regulator|nr:Fur family transcriptional regulator [Arcobacteraceae bacterium]